MKEIKGVDLADLVSEVSIGLLDERREQAASIIKQQLQRMEQLTIDVKNAEKELKKKQDKLTKAQDKIDKVKSGNWQILSDIKKQENS